MNSHTTAADTTRNMAVCPGLRVVKPSSTPRREPHRIRAHLALVREGNLGALQSVAGVDPDLARRGDQHIADTRASQQRIQHTRPPKRWILKGFHGRRLRALFDTYPDARIVWVHRDPVQVLASQIVAFGQINESLAGGLDWTQYARATIEGSRANFHAYLTDPLVDDPRIHHVRYRDFVADPVAAIGGFYDFVGLQFSAEAEKGMRDYLVTNRSDRYGKFTYSTDVLPVPVEQLHNEFADYRGRFGIDIETRR